MLAWNGDAENMIDRFDGRALLDFYKDPDPRNKPQKTDDELELEEVPLPSYAFTTLEATFEEVYTLISGMLDLSLQLMTAVMLATTFDHVYRSRSIHDGSCVMCR